MLRKRLFNGSQLEFQDERKSDGKPGHVSRGSGPVELHSASFKGIGLKSAIWTLVIAILLWLPAAFIMGRNVLEKLGS